LGEQRTEPNAADRLTHGENENNHDMTTTIDTGEQEEYKYWYLQDESENDDDNDRSDKGEVLEANKDSEDTNDSENENEITKAIKKLRSPSKSPEKRVDDTNGVEERQSPHSQKLESKVNLDDDEKGRFQESDSENEQGSTKTILNNDGSNGIDAEQEHAYDSQSTEMQRSMDRERRFQLWLEHGVYVPASGSEIPSGSSQSQSRSSSASPPSASPPSASPPSAVPTNGTHVKENESSKKWWKRMGSLFHRRKENVISKQELSTTSYSKSGISGSEIMNGGDDAIVVSNKRYIDKAQDYSDIENLGISLVKPNPVGKYNDQSEIKDGLNEPSRKNISLAVAAAATGRMKTQQSPMTEDDYDRLYQKQNETSFTGGSLADQIAAAARSRKNNKPSQRSAEDFDNLYQTKNETSFTGGSLSDQIAAAARSRKKNQSAPMTEAEYDKLYEPKNDTKSTDSSLADQVAAAAIAMKLKNQSAPMTEAEYDKLYKQKKERKRTEGSLADQVAAAAMAVKLKKQSAPMTEEDYDKIYDPSKVMDSMDRSLSDKVASAAMAVKLKNKTTPMTEEDYDKLYEPKKERKETDESLANQIAAAAIARKKYKSEEDYGNLYQKPKRLSEEPKRMVNLKFANEGRPSARRIAQDHPENNVSDKFEEDFEISISSSNTSDDESDRELKENSISANPSPSTNSSVSFKPPKSIQKPTERNGKMGPFVWFVNIMVVVAAIAALYCFLRFSDFTNDSQSSAPEAPIGPNFEITRLPSSFPTLPTPLKPTTSITYTQSPMPSFRRSTNPPTSQPTSKPVLNPTVQQTFPTATPVSTPLTNSPTQAFIDIDKPVTLSPSMVSTNQPVLNTAKPILPEATESPQVDPEAFLRQLLVSRWPPLIQSLFIPFSPQSKAFEWLVDLDSDLNAYSERQLIQRFVMATFFFSTNGENWSSNEGWLSAENECRWYQTKSYRDACDASGSLLNLELNGNGLSGSLPSELALLSDSLTRLDLAKTNDSNEVFLGGNLPSEIGMLTMLQYISLSKQQMTGTIPNEVGKLSLLTVLDLERNKFEGSLTANIGDLQQLYNLYLGSNNLSGDIASEVGRLQFLINLDLRGNDFSSSLPSELGKLSFLQSLSLGGNKLTGTIPSFLGRLSNLQGTFDLSGNLLSGTIPTTLGQLSMLLTVLNLSSNNLSGPIPIELDRLVKLGNLQLQNNLLTGSIPPSFYKLSQLQILQLQYNNLTGDVAAAVCDNLVTNKIDDKMVPTSLLTDCLFKVNCECCQYCCAEGTGCECQFTNTKDDFLCRHGDTLGPMARITNNINN
jgi:Leucine-rich repeat (LRR) protein